MLQLLLLWLLIATVLTVELYQAFNHIAIIFCQAANLANVGMYVCIAQWVLLSNNKPWAHRIVAIVDARASSKTLLFSDLLKLFIDGSQIRANETRWLQKGSSKVSSQACKLCLGYSFSAWLSMPYHQNIPFSLFNTQIDIWPPINQKGCRSK